MFNINMFNVIKFYQSFKGYECFRRFKIDSDLENSKLSLKKISNKMNFYCKTIFIHEIQYNKMSTLKLLTLVDVFLNNKYEII